MATNFLVDSVLKFITLMQYLKSQMKKHSGEQQCSFILRILFQKKTIVSVEINVLGIKVYHAAGASFLVLKTMF